METDFTHFDDQAPQQPPQATWRGRDVLWISLGILFVFALGIIALRVWLGNNAGPITLRRNTIYLSAALGALEGVAIIGSVYLLGLRRRSLPWSAVGLQPAEQKWVALAVAIGILMIPLAGMIAWLIQLLLGLPQTNPQLDFLAPDGFSWFGVISMFVLGGLIGPFAEELFFRGILYTWLRDTWGTTAGTIISALVFGIVHGDIAVGGAAAVLGLFLAWIYEHSHSLWTSVLIHLINNGVKILLLYAVLAAGIQLTGG